PELAMGARDPGWVDRVQHSLTPQERKALLISVLLQASQILRQAANRYERMDAETLDKLFNQEQLGLVSINQMQLERLQYRVAGLRELIAREAVLFPNLTEESRAPDVVMMAALPLFWEAAEFAESGEEMEG